MKRKPNSEIIYLESDGPQITRLLEQVENRLELPKKQRLLMRQDYLKALRCFFVSGVPLDEALKRLDPAQLGDFYRLERTDWYPLDHAAKVYPLSMSLNRMMVFRLSGYLQSDVQPALLQIALHHVAARFPYFATTIKCGFFWHYLDGTKRSYRVRPETKLPCAVMRVNAYNSPSFRVVYYKNRVSVEFFHILTDGAGGMFFLKTLLAEYLRLQTGKPIPAEEGVFDVSAQPSPAEWADDFLLGDKPVGAKGFSDQRAIQLSGGQPFETPSRVLHLHLSVEQLKQRAHQLGGSITALLLGYLFLACKEAIPTRTGRKRIQIQLPVNMRKFYPSGTLRNFSMYCSIRLKPAEITTLRDIVPLINAQIKEGASKEKLDQTMAMARRLVKALRFVPLIVKRPIAYVLFGALGDGVFTTTLSNLGEINVPNEMRPYLRKFDFVLGPPTLNRATFSLCSYAGTAMLTITKNTQNETVENALYRLLSEDGLEPYVEGSR